MEAKNVLVFNFLEMKGTSKASGQPYHFAQLQVAIPAESLSNEKMTKTSHGYEAQKMDVPVDDIQLVQRMHQIPIMERVTLHLQPDPRDFSKMQVCGWDEE